MGLLIFHPLMQVASSKDDVVQQPADLGDFSFKTRLIQVQSTGPNDVLLVIFYATTQNTDQPFFMGIYYFTLFVEGTLRKPSTT